MSLFILPASFHQHQPSPTLQRNDIISFQYVRCTAKPICVGSCIVFGVQFYSNWFMRKVDNAITLLPFCPRQKTQQGKPDGALLSPDCGIFYPVSKAYFRNSFNHFGSSFQMNRNRWQGLTSSNNQYCNLIHHFKLPKCPQHFYTG